MVSNQRVLHALAALAQGLREIDDILQDEELVPWLRELNFTLQAQSRSGHPEGAAASGEF